MRLLLLVVLGCRGTAPAERREPLVNNAAPVSAAPGDEQLAGELAKLPEEHVLYVHPVGWFSARHYERYHGTNPRSGERVVVPDKTLVYWSSSPAFLAELAAQPSPISDSYPTEKARYRAAMSLEADPPDDADDPTVVDRPVWADELGKRLHRELVTGGRAVVRGVGTLEVARDRSDPLVRFRPEAAFGEGPDGD